MAYNIKNVLKPSYHSIYETHENCKEIFLIRVFWFKYTFSIEFEIRILDLMLLPKNSVQFEGQYYSSSFILKWIFFILAVKRANNKSLIKFEFCKIQSLPSDLASIERLKNQ